MKKNLPDLKEYSILPPDMDYIYFEGGEDFPFEADNRDYSPVNAWWFAEFAFLVYCHPGFARMAARLAGFDGFRFFQGKGTECMVCWNDRAAVISFRGTELNSISTFHEIITDLNTLPADFPSGGKVHRGFLNGLYEVWEGENGLEAFITGLLDGTPERPVWVTGHSLGGALAELCFASVPGITGLYVYGAPRVGDETFVGLTAGRPAWRVEHARDPVPMVPLDVPAAGVDFKDMGGLVYIDQEGKILPERPVLSGSEEIAKIRSTLRDQKKRRTLLTARALKEKIDGKEIREAIQSHINLALKEWKDYFSTLDRGIGLKVLDHMPIYYCIRLWNVL